MSTTSLRRLPLAFFGLTLVTGGAGCGVLLGLDDFTEGQGTGSGGGTAASSSGTGGGGGASSSTGGAGGTGGMPMPCTPKETKACYSGAAGTQDKGICKGGKQTCKDDGSSFGACVGEVVPALENCAAPDDEDCNGTAAQCTGTPQWGKRFGNATGNQGMSGVALDSKGNTILSGGLKGAVNFGKDNVTGTAYMAKLDPSGSHVFSKALPSAGLMAVDSSDNVVLVGNFSGSLDFGSGALDAPEANNIFLAKFAPAGSLLLSKTVGHGSFVLYDVATGPDGSVFLAGLIKGTVDLGGGPLGTVNTYSAFVAKYDKNGDHSYSRRFGVVGSIGGAQAQAIAVDGAGNAVIAAGMYGSLVDFGGVKLNPSAGTFAVVKIDPAGNVLYAKQFVGVNAGLVDASMTVVTLGNYDIAVDPKGDVFLAGDFTGNVNFGTPALTGKGGKDIFVAKLDPMGGHLWSKSFGNTGDQIATHVAVDMFGNPAVTGVFPDYLDLGNGIFLNSGTSKEHVFGLKLDTDGSYLWALGSSGSALSKVSSTSVAVSALGEVVFSGTTKDMFSFGMVPAQSGGFFDTYVAKLAP